MNKIMNKIKTIFIKHREPIVYLIFGVLTTAINLATAYIIDVATDIPYLINNIIAWVVGVIFAFITNKIFVFQSKQFSPKILLKESSEFLGARLFSLAVEEFGLWLLMDIVNFDEFSKNILGFTVTGMLISKVILAVIVVILNYIFSKFIIFRKK